METTDQLASRALSKTEQRYAQIEKEGLAITWACERFQEYVIGLEFHVETDHKPLVPLFSTKILDELPPRIQRFKMRLMRFKFSISHVPGKSLTTADALSRAPIRTSQDVASSPGGRNDRLVHTVMRMHLIFLKSKLLSTA